jgi:uncharacterized membrane protein YbhN (UPF0104 family)
MKQLPDNPRQEPDLERPEPPLGPVVPEPKQAEEPERPPHSWRRRIFGFLLSVAVIVATFVFVLPRIASYAQVFHIVEKVSWEGAVVLVAATVLNIVTFAPQWTAALPELDFKRALYVTQASTASTYVAPGGAAVGIAVSLAMLRRYGFRSRPIALAVTLVSVWNQLVLFALPVVGFVLLALTGVTNHLLRTVAVVGVGVFVAGVVAFVLAFGSTHVARWVGNLTSWIVTRLRELVHRSPARFSGASFVEFRNETAGLLSRRWLRLTFWTFVSQMTVFVVLFATLRVLGVPSTQVGITEAFAAWAALRLLGSLPITPGGIGVVELGLVGALTGFGGHRAPVVASVLVYRFLTIVPTLLVGLWGAIAWRLSPKPRIPSDQQWS